MYILTSSCFDEVHGSVSLVDSLSLAAFSMTTHFAGSGQGNDSWSIPFCTNIYIHQKGLVKYIPGQKCCLLERILELK